MTPMNLFQPAAFFNPMMLWADIAMKASEMMVASTQVIGNRVDRIARAGASPSLADRKEFLLMGTEKMKAANESALAMVTNLQLAQMQMFSQALRQWVGGDWGSWARASTRAARFTSEAMAPVHRAATANARRLSRVKRTRKGG